MKKKYCVSKACLGPTQWVVSIWEWDKVLGRYIQRYFKALPTDLQAEAWVAGASHALMQTHSGDWFTHVGDDPNVIL